MDTQTARATAASLASANLSREYASDVRIAKNLVEAWRVACLAAWKARGDKHARVAVDALRSARELALQSAPWLGEMLDAIGRDPSRVQLLFTADTFATPADFDREPRVSDSVPESERWGMRPASRAFNLPLATACEGFDALQLALDELAHRLTAERAAEKAADALADAERKRALNEKAATATLARSIAITNGEGLPLRMDTLYAGAEITDHLHDRTFTFVGLCRDARTQTVCGVVRMNDGRKADFYKLNLSSLGNPSREKIESEFERMLADKAAFHSIKPRNAWH